MIEKKIRICEVCGVTSETHKVHCHPKSNMTLCNKHYQQMKAYGKILERTISDPNEIIINDFEAEIVIYNRKHEEIARCIIDKEDINKIKDHNWHMESRHKKYIATQINRKTVKIHRFLMNAKENEQVDHIDGNPLNNKKSNLRIVNGSQNSINRFYPNRNKSGVIGVHWITRDEIWIAKITVDKKDIILYRGKDKEEAIRRRKEAEEKYYGEYSYYKSRNIK